MAQKYMLVPLADDIFAKYDLVTRAVIGALYNRYKLSCYQVSGGNDHYVDDFSEEIYCIYSHRELVRLIGVSEKTIRRSLDRLKDDRLIWWRKDRYGGANRYFLDDLIIRYMRTQ